MEGPSGYSLRQTSPVSRATKQEDEVLSDWCLAATAVELLNADQKPTGALLVVLPLACAGLLG